MKSNPDALFQFNTLPLLPLADTCVFSVSSEECKGFEASIQDLLVLLAAVIRILVVQDECAWDIWAFTAMRESLSCATDVHRARAADVFGPEHHAFGCVTSGTIRAHVLAGTAVGAAESEFSTIHVITS
jgi:hypothetical protein